MSRLTDITKENSNLYLKSESCRYDYLIVGAGLFGAVFAHEMNKAGKKCLVIDKRDHIGGNVYTKEIEGINVHMYGAHIFHTSNKRVWDYVNDFAEFNRYTNCPVAFYKDEVYNLPFNMNTFSRLWGVKTPDEAEAKIEEQRKEAAIGEPKNLEEQAISLVGKDIYEKLIKGYTEKQWGKRADELPAFIIKRLPVRLTYDNNYFNDLYQGIPIGGYTAMIEKMLDGVEVRLGADYFSDREYYKGLAGKIIFTGMIDEYYDYCYGELEYRSLKFETEILDTDNYQGNAVVNYTEFEIPYTRIIEHKHFETTAAKLSPARLSDSKASGSKISVTKVSDNVVSGDGLSDDVERKSHKTVITREYPVNWQHGDEPYYPMNDEKNNALYAKYKALADKEDKVIFGGRLGMYKYYDMHNVIDEALKLADFFKSSCEN